MFFMIRTGVAIPSGRGSYNFAAFTDAEQAAFVPTGPTERGKKAASLRASARRYTEENGVAFLVRAGEDEGKPGVWVWRVTPAAPAPAAPAEAAPTVAETKGIPRGKK